MHKPVNWPQTVVGLTGGIASGKSTVGKILAGKGLHVIDADDLARETVLPRQPAWEELVETFGAVILNENQNINRSVLLNILLEEPHARHEVETIIHPRVFELLDVRLSALAKKGQDIVIVEVPLLFEANWEALFDFIVMVKASDAVCIERLMKRKDISIEKAIKWFSLQMPQDEKARRSDYVLENDKDFDHLSSRVEDLIARLAQLPQKKSPERPRHPAIH